MLSTFTTSERGQFFPSSSTRILEHHLFLSFLYLLIFWFLGLAISYSLAYTLQSALVSSA